MVEEAKPLDFPLKPTDVAEKIKAAKDAPDQPIVDGAAVLKAVNKAMESDSSLATSTVAQKTNNSTNKEADLIPLDQNNLQAFVDSTIDKNVKSVVDSELSSLFQQWQKKREEERSKRQKGSMDKMEMKIKSMVQQNLMQQSMMQRMIMMQSMMMSAPQQGLFGPTTGAQQ